MERFFLISCSVVCGGDKGRVRERGGEGVVKGEGLQNFLLK